MITNPQLQLQRIQLFNEAYRDTLSFYLGSFSKWSYNNEVLWHN